MLFLRQTAQRGRAAVAGQKSVFTCDGCVALAAQNVDPQLTDQGPAARQIVDTLPKPPPQHR